MLNKPNKEKSLLRHLVMFFAMFYYYIGPFSFVAYFLALFNSKIKLLSLVDWFIILSLAITLSFAIYVDDLVDSIIIFRFNWGFLFFYLFFKSSPDLNLNISKLLFILIAITLIESILINTIIDVALLSNYPGQELSNEIWQRVNGFGGNASVLGGLLVVILSISAQSTGLIFATFLTIILIGSGSGLLSFILYMILAKYKYKGLILSIILLIFFLVYQLNENIFSKISIEYIAFLYDLKLTQIDNKLYESSLLQLFFGTLNRDASGGDFLWLSFYKMFGIFGVFLMSIALLRHINKKNAIGIFLIVLFTLHYFILFSLPGQLIIGYLLALKPKKT